MLERKPHPWNQSYIEPTSVGLDILLVPFNLNHREVWERDYSTRAVPNMAVVKAFEDNGCVPDVIDTAPAELAEVPHFDTTQL